MVRGRFALITGVGLCAAVILGRTAYGQEEPSLYLPDIRGMAKQADFIFKGAVTKVEYRNSEYVPVRDESGKQVYDEDNQPVFADGSNLPHSFVTYQIEKVYKGKPPQAPGGGPSTTLTLQMVGGICQEKPGEIVFVPHYPHMDPGDRDLLFVLQNTIRPCPLVGSEKGRFRVLVDPAIKEPRIYSDVGHEIVHVQFQPPIPDEIDYGPKHPLEEVMTYKFGDCDGCTLEKVTVDEGDESGLPAESNPKGPQFREADFDTFVARIVAETHTPEELQQWPPVDNADSSKPFEAESYSEDAPKDDSQAPPPEWPRPWLDQLPPDQQEAVFEAERIEAQLLALNGGNPVLPANECEMRILLEGPMPGDISGPEGKRDCYVDFYDFLVIAESWLECNAPGDPSCL